MDIASLGVEVTPVGLDKTTRQLDDLTRAADKTSTSVQRAETMVARAGLARARADQAVAAASAGRESEEYKLAAATTERARVTLLLATATESETRALQAVAVANATAAAAAADLADRKSFLRAKFDETYASSLKLSRELEDLAEAERLGVTITQGYSATLDALVNKHDAAAAAAARQAKEYADLAAAEKLAATSMDAQAYYNRATGVAGNGTSARQSAEVFSAELGRMEQIAQQKAAEIGRTFGEQLDERLVPAVRSSARESATVFEAELDRLADVARLKAVEAGSVFTRELNTRLRVDVRGNSASASASVFEEEIQRVQALEQSAARLRTQIDPLGTAQDRFNREMAEYNMLAAQGIINAKELGAAHALAASRLSNYQAVINGMESTASGRAANLANVVAQFQDVGVTAAMGMNPLTIALQQGTQLSQALIQMERPIAGLIQGFKAMLSLTSLLTIGLIGLAAAALQWLMSTYQATETAEKALDRHSKALESVVKGYENAETAVSDYFEAAQTLSPELASSQTVSEFQALAEEVTKAEDVLASFANNDYWSKYGTESVHSLQQVAAGVIDGSASMEDFYESVKDAREELSWFERQSELIPGSLAGTLAALEQAALKAIFFSDAINQVIAASHALASISTNEDLFNALNLQAYVDEQERLNGMTSKQLELEKEKQRILSEAGEIGMTEAMAERLAAEAIAADDRRSALEKSSTASTKLRDSYKDLILEGRNFIEEQTLEASALGMTEQAANALRYEQEMLNKAANDNIQLTPAQRSELSALAHEMSVVEEQTRTLTQWYEIGRSAFGSFLSDFRRDLMNGTSLWESFGNAAARALDSIAERALSMAANGIFDMIFGAIMGGITGGNPLSLGAGGPGFLGGGVSAWGSWATGGYTGNGPADRAAGIVHGREYVMSASATRRIGVGALDAMNSGGAVPANSNSFGGDVYITNQIHVDSNTNPETAPAIAREVTVELRRQLPDAIKAYNSNPHRRVS